MKRFKPAKWAATCLLCAATSYSLAQQSPGPHRLFVLPDGTFGPVPCTAAIADAGSKTTGPELRVTAAVEETASGDFFDSTVFRYSAGRGSRFNYQLLQYDKGFPGNDPAMDAFAYARLAVQADTTLQYIRSFGGPLELTQRHRIAYGAGNRVDTFTVHYNGNGILDDGYRYDNGFDASGRTVRSFLHWWDVPTASYQPGRERLLTYSAQHRVLTDSTYVYSAGVRSLSVVNYHTYNGSGQLMTSQRRMLIGGVLQPYMLFTYGYNASGQIVTSLLQTYNGGTAQNYTIDSMEYGPGLPFPVRTSLYQWDAPNSSWRAELREAYFVNAAQLPDSVYTYGYDHANNVWVPFHKDLIAYNSSGTKPVRIDTWDISDPLNPARERQCRFYYESYQTTGLERYAPGPVLKALAYPNPAGSTLLVAVKNLGQVPVRLMIYSPLGQLLQCLGLPLSPENLFSIDVSRLPGGSYLLVVEAGGQRFTTNFLKK